jgi:hypothetical protein
MLMGFGNDALWPCDEYIRCPCHRERERGREGGREGERERERERERREREEREREREGGERERRRNRHRHGQTHIPTRTCQRSHTKAKGVQALAAARATDSIPKPQT